MSGFFTASVIALPRVSLPKNTNRAIATATVAATIAIAAVIMPMMLGDGGLQRGVDRGDQIAQLVHEPRQHRAGVGRHQFGQVGRYHARAPCTMNCIRKAPIPNISEPLENAHSGITGNASSAAMMIAFLRPIFSDNEPKKTPPIMDAIL